MLSSPVKFHLCLRSVSYSLSPYTLTLLHSLTPFHSEPVEGPKKKNHSLLPDFFLSRRRCVLAESHSFRSFTTLKPVSPVFATLTKTPGGGPLPRHKMCGYIAH